MGVQVECPMVKAQISAESGNLFASSHISLTESLVVLTNQEVSDV